MDGTRVCMTELGEDVIGGRGEVMLVYGRKGRERYGMWYVVCGYVVCR